MQVVMDDSANLDLSALNFEEFEHFFFDRRVVKPSEGTFIDAFCPGISSFASSSPAKTVELLKLVMSDFKRIGNRYSLEQIDQGVWALFGPFIEVQEHLWMDRVSLGLRQRCIRAMAVPYRDFVCGHPVEQMENCFDMWWDLVAHDFWAQIGLSPSTLNDDNRAMLNAMFETLCEILALPDSRCQQYALHGLGHLRHPDVTKVVQKFMDENRNDLAPEALAWIEGCRDGNIM
jgi:hypothetical protein